MAYLTENQLNNVVDIPIALSSTDLRMGDWIVAATVKIEAPMRLSYRMANIAISGSTVNTANITSGNLIYGNLGLAYLALRRDYITGSPGAAGGLDVLVAYDLGVYTRDPSSAVLLTTPGVYSWIISSNMQPSTDTSPVIPLTTSIDFRISVSGSARLELDSA
jgi:hypothetical protein